MVKIFIYSYIFLFPAVCLAQKAKTTFISYEAGLSVDNISFSSSDAQIKMLNNKAAITGLTITQEIRRPFYLEMGIYDKFIGADFPSYIPDSTNLAFAVNTRQLPFRLVLGKTFFKGRLHIFPSAGISFYLTHGYNGIYYSDNYYDLQVHGVPIGRRFSTLDAGCSVNYFLFKNFSLGLVYQHTYSFKKVADYRILASRTDGSTTGYNISYSGVTNNVLLKVQFRVSSLWNRNSCL